MSWSHILEKIFDSLVVHVEWLLVQVADLGLKSSNSLDEFVIISVFEITHSPVVCV